MAVIIITIVICLFCSINTKSINTSKFEVLRARRRMNKAIKKMAKENKEREKRGEPPIYTEL